MRLPIFPAALAALLVSACATTGYPRVGPVPPDLPPRRYAALQYFASLNLKCPQEYLQYEPFGAGRTLFKGCGNEMEMIMFEGPDGVAYGYENGYIMPGPSYRFSKETGCDPRTTIDERVDYKTHIVEGCGHRVTYVNVCARASCSWAANDIVGADAAR
jgi:hypothetical protein